MVGVSGAVIVTVIVVVAVANVPIASTAEFLKVADDQSAMTVAIQRAF